MTVAATVFAALHHHDVGTLLFVLGIIIVLGCLVAAAVAAWRGIWIAALVLLAVAIVAAILLL